jgi:hypothetical protein
MLPGGMMHVAEAVEAWWARHGSTAATPGDDGVTLPAAIRGAIAPPPPQMARDAVRRALADGVLRAEALFDDGSSTEPIAPEFWRGTAGGDAMWPGERVSVPSRPLTAIMLPGATLPVVVNAPEGRPIVNAAEVQAWLVDAVASPALPTIGRELHHGRLRAALAAGADRAEAWLREYLTAHRDPTTGRYPMRKQAIGALLAEQRLDDPDRIRKRDAEAGWARVGKAGLTNHLGRPRASCGNDPAPETLPGKRDH